MLRLLLLPGETVYYYQCGNETLRRGSNVPVAAGRLVKLIPRRAVPRKYKYQALHLRFVPRSIENNRLRKQ